MMKRLFAATFLATLPALVPMIAAAEGCSSKHMDMQAMSCVEGTTWDAATSTCVEQITS